MLVTLYLLLVIFYLFSFAAFNNSVVRDDYNADENSPFCRNLLECFIYTIDLTFKSNGGIGGFLYGAHNDGAYDSIVEDDGRRRYSMNWYRFWYDNLELIIILIILFEIFGAIFVDTFPQLREEEETRKDD